MDARMMLVVGAAVLAGLVPGWLLARLAGAGGALGWAALLVAAMFAGIVLGRQTEGWDALGYSAGVVMLLTPAAFGALIGGGLGLLGIVYIGVNVFGAYGIANELKRGYQVAVVASFLPIALPAVVLTLQGDLIGRLGEVLVPGGILNAVFVYALIALLLHSQSREHQKVWFS